jgi:histidinol phosphatase-like enzyme
LSSITSRTSSESQWARRDLRPGILLDPDGTVIVDHGYVGSTDRVGLITGAPEAIAAFSDIFS